MVNDNISKIENAFADIKNAIENQGIDVGECESPTTYAEKINSLVGSGTGIESVEAYAYNVDDDTPTVTADIVDNKMRFTFGLVRGLQGPAGKDGVSGSDGKDGQDGKDGADGVSGTRFEFLYTRVANENIPVEAPQSVNEDLYEPEGWYLSPKGVTDDLQVEYICQREKENGIWGGYSVPAIWAMYGKIGRDGNGIEYIYKLTKDESENPGQPVAPSNILPESYPEDWSDDPISVNNLETVCWVSTRKQYYENNTQYWSDYSKPTVWAKYGKDGKEGGGRTIFMFTATDNKTDAPNTPSNSEISWNPDTNEITVIEGSVWKTNADEVSGKYIWLTSGSFDGFGTLLNEWSAPIKITGDDGINGTDGLTTEFIYRLISNEGNFQQLVEYLSDNPLEVTDTDTVPETKDDICKSKWTDSPLGIDGETWSMEVTCVRTKQSDGSWGAWSSPIRWAVWGEDGVDGDGVEYIFKVTPADVTNTNISDTHSLYIPPKSWYDTNGYGKIYQTNEFYPGNSDKWSAELDLDWTDEPRDVGPDKPLEWVSIRRKINGIWGDFSSPKLWAKYAEDGYAYKTSYVFTRSNDKPATPKNGSITKFDYPIPIDPDDKVVWSDTVPEGSEQVWMSYKTFYGKPNVEIDDDWSSPMLMQDRSDFQVEYSAIEAPKQPISLQTYFGRLVTGGNLEPSSEEVEAAFKEENADWSDEVTNAIWMATASYKNGNWTGWNVTRIKGEKGDAGPAGTSISIKGTFTYSQLVAADTYFFNPTGTKPSPYFTDDALTTGDCYVISSGNNSEGKDVSGHMFVYDGSGSTFGERWVDAGKMQGPAGQSQYFYIAFADTWGGPIKTLSDGSIDPNGGKYVGYCVSNGVLDKDVLLEWDTYTTWSEWKGDDGFGVEQIFLLTHKDSNYNEDNAPEIPKEKNITQGYCPNHGLGSDAYGSKWTDTPQSVSKEYPYQWVVSRKWDGINEYEWKGSVDESGASTGKASLHNRYAYDGNSSYKLALSQDYFLVPCEEDGTIDADFNEEIKTSMSLFIGDDPVLTGVTYTADGYNVENEVLTITPEQFKNLGEVTQIICTGTYNNIPTTSVFTIEKTKNAYNIDPQIITIKKDPETLYPLIDSFNTNVYRWNGKGWSNYNGIIYVDFIHSDGSSETENFTVNDEECTITINDKKDLEYIKLYLSTNSKYYEKVDVVKDGKDGVSPEPSLSITVSSPTIWKNDEGYLVDTNITFSISAYSESTKLTVKSVQIDGIKSDDINVLGDTITFDAGNSPIAGSSKTYDLTINFNEGQIANATLVCNVLTRIGGPYVLSLSPDNYMLTCNSDGVPIDKDDITTTYALFYNHGDITKDTGVTFEIDDKSQENYVTIENGVLTVKLEAITVNNFTTRINAKVSNKTVDFKVFTITKVLQGQQGQKGENGTSINIKGTLSSTDDLVDIQNKSLGDTYVIGGHLWVYNGNEDGVNGFEDLGQFVGKGFQWLGTLSAPPNEPKEGDVYMNLTDGKTYIYSSTGWDVFIINVGYSITLDPGIVTVDYTDTTMTPSEVRVRAFKTLGGVVEEIDGFKYEVWGTIYDSKEDSILDLTEVFKDVTKQSVPVHLLDSDGNSLGVSETLEITKESAPAISPIAIHLDNEHGEMSWYANNKAIKSNVECNITAIRGTEPKEITNCTALSDVFSIETMNANGKWNIKISSDTKVPVGTYEIPVILEVDGEELTRTITVTVKEIPNMDVDIVMDQTIEVDYIAKKIVTKEGSDPWWLHFIPIVGSTIYIACEYKWAEEFHYVHIPQAIEVGVKAICNGNRTDWSVSKIICDGYEIDSELYKITNAGLYISYDAVPENLLESKSITGQIVFEVADQTITKDVVFVSPRSTIDDFKLSFNQLNYGNSSEVELISREVNSKTWSDTPVITSELLKVTINDVEVEITNGKYRIDNITSDIVFKLWTKGDISSEDWLLSGIQTVSCIKQPEVNYYTIESLTPFVQVNEAAHAGNGQLVGDPIQLVIKHHVGNNVTTTTVVPEGLNVNVFMNSITPIWTFDEYDDLEKLSDIEDLYINLDSIEFVLSDVNNDNQTIDSITIEKTVVYPNPLIYPAGEFSTDENVVYEMSFTKVPYVSVIENEGVMYYIGNRDILKYDVNFQLTGGVKIEEETFKISEGNEIPCWNEMQSFEAIYADIGVFKQALVGPLVFYEDYVFSQDGTALVDFYYEGNTASSGDEITYANALSGEKLAVNNSAKFWDLFKPNFKLNAKTGKLSLNNKSGEATVTIDDGIQMNYNDIVNTVAISRTTEWHPRTGLNLQYSNKTTSWSGESVPVINIENVTDNIGDGWWGASTYRNTAPPIVVNAVDDSYVSIRTKGAIAGTFVNSITDYSGFKANNNVYVISTTGTISLPDASLGAFPIGYELTLYIINSGLTITGFNSLWDNGSLNQSGSVTTTKPRIMKFIKYLNTSGVGACWIGHVVC